MSTERQNNGQRTVLRLLLVSPKPPPNGGIGHWTLLVMAWLQGEPDVLLSHVNTAPRWRGVADVSLSRRLAGGSIQGVRDLCRVLIQLVRFRPNVIHLTTSGSLAGLRDIALLCLARMLRVASVYHIRFGRIPQLVEGGGWEWRLLRRAMRLAHRVLVIDRATESALKGIVPTERLALVPNGIALDPVRPAEATGSKRTKTVYFLGWVIPTKGIRELLEAWRIVGRPGWELKVAGPGDGGFRREMEQSYANGAKVHFLGEVSHLQGWNLMQDADIFVLPSYTEGFPNVILEAMAAGKAIVATRVGAIPEMLDAESDRPCGVLVDPKAPPLLAAALSCLMDDPALCLEMGRRARAKVERGYDARVVFGRYSEIWRALASDRHHAFQSPVTRLTD